MSKEKTPVEEVQLPVEGDVKLPESGAEAPVEEVKVEAPVEVVPEVAPEAEIAPVGSPVDVPPVVEAITPPSYVKPANSQYDETLPVEDRKPEVANWAFLPDEEATILASGLELAQVRNEIGLAIIEHHKENTKVELIEGSTEAVSVVGGVITINEAIERAKAKYQK